MLHYTAALVSRFAWVGILILAAVFVGYSSVRGTSEDLSPYGGLRACFACDNGWNWHFLLFTLAFPVFMLESLLAFRAPIFPQRSAEQSCPRQPPLLVHRGGQPGGAGPDPPGLTPASTPPYPDPPAPQRTHGPQVDASGAADIGAGAVHRGHCGHRAGQAGHLVEAHVQRARLVRRRHAVPVCRPGAIDERRCVTSPRPCVCASGSAWQLLQ